MNRIVKLMCFLFVLLCIFTTGCRNKEADSTNGFIDEKNNCKLQEAQNRDKILKKTLEALMESLEKNDTDYSVFLYIPEAEFEYVYHNKPMKSASMIKVFILEMAYRDIANGRLSEDAAFCIEKDTRVGGAGSLQGCSIGTLINVETLLRKMIVESDNTATNMMIKYYGMEKINEYIKRQGYNDTSLNRYMMDYDALAEGKDNLTSVKDLGEFFKRLYYKSAVNSTFDEKMIKILKDQEDNDKIPYYLPQGIQVAHKTGEMLKAMNDGGIVYGKHPYILCILTDNAPGYSLAIKQVAKLAHDIDREVNNWMGNETEGNTQVKESVEIKDKPVIFSEYKMQLIKEYSNKHYGENYSQIIPQAVVLHWTASNEMASAFNWFNREEYENEPGTLNVCSHYIVDRDGSIYQLMPETMMARHSIGYNWCSIGIENVGGENHIENLTQEQVEANVKLISYLKNKYPSIKYVWGHYQQEEAKCFGLYRENIEGYFHGKDDPGSTFVNEVKKRLAGTDILFL